MKHLLLWFLITFSSFILIQSKKAPVVKFDGDFEFADEDDKKNYVKFALSEKKKWIHDPSNDLCKPLNCKKKELCLLEDAFTAVCVSKKELHRNRDELLVKYKVFEEEAKRKAETVESNERNKSSFASSDFTTDTSREDDSASIDFEESKNKCKPCTSVKTMFLCGSDNRTYSSMCRLNYNNCLQNLDVRKVCAGFCPCKDEQRKKKGNGKNKKQYSKEGKKDDENQYSKINYAYQLTPEDLKYDNKHYEFIKFTPDGSKKTHESQAPISVNLKDKNYYDGRPVAANKFAERKNECSRDQLVAIGNRLLDWFSVITFDSKKKPSYHKKYGKEFLSSLPCKPEVRKMFQHLDSNFDGILSTQELYQIEHDKNEDCIKPFLDTCDWDKNKMFDIREWCSCFEKTDRPCIAVRRRIESNEDNSYTPNCDDQGFYRPIQCHNILQVCWCVDKHGVEFANTRSKNKKPDCDEVLKNASTMISDYTDDEDLRPEQEEEDKDESSGDKLLMF